MFILECTCGGEIYGDESDACDAWQCDECGKWYDLFGQEVPHPNAAPSVAVFKDYAPEYENEE